MSYKSKNKKKQNINFYKYILGLIIFCFFLYLLSFNFLNNKYINDEVISIDGVDKIYIALSEKKKLDLDIITTDKNGVNLYYTSSDESIVTVTNNGYISGKSIGNASVFVSSSSGVSKTIEIYVTDLITNPNYAQKKEELLCNVFTENEARLLDDILKTDIDNAGYKTRAGVVAAARFLSLKFPYKINYFFENGRLTDEGDDYRDGEGRYYHTGLYLSSDKYQSLDSDAISNEPVIWGCDLYSYGSKTYSRNGFNCSGFISWVMLNGGFDVGDIGAGITEKYDFTDMGEKVNIDLDLLNSVRIKVGDLIGRNGHIAIIIGIEDNKIYIAESYIPSMKVREFTFEELVNSDDFKYIILMDSVYKNDGKITNMW